MISDPDSVEEALKKMPDGPGKEDIKRRLEYQKEVDYADDLIKIATEDMASSKILLDKEKYPNSVYLIQQSVEKSTKAFFLLSEVSKSQELKNIGHYPSKKHLEEVKSNLKKASDLTEAIERDSKLKEIPMIRDLDLEGFKYRAIEAEKIIKNVNENGIIYSDDLKILDFNLSETDKLLLDAEKFDLKNLDKITEAELITEFTDNIKSLFKIMKEKELYKISEEEEKRVLEVGGEFLKHLTLRQAESMIYSGTCQAVNSVLNLFLEPHFSLSRYPGKKNPLKYYIPENPLIKRLPDLIRIQKRNLEIHEKYLSIIRNSFPDVIVEK